MKKIAKITMAALVAASSAVPAAVAQEKVTGWGDFKLYIDPGHEGRSNQGLWGYSEAEKVLYIGLQIKDWLETYTDMPAENLKMCRYTESDTKGLTERSEEANAWGADFYYSIHSDAGSNVPNKIVLLFGGWKNNGQLVEKTPNGGKRYGEFLEPNMMATMRVGSRGNRYDRDFYYSGQDTHENQYPYLSVNRVGNMPSLLSEGAYHTLTEQQQRNLNEDYKKLEALAAFQAILSYVGLDKPAQTFVHGCVTNDENGQPINGAKITLDGKTYTTDTYESLFNKYSKNPNLIHNGLFTFEGIAPGEYTITYEAEGFTSVTKTITVADPKAGTSGNSGDYVTFADVALTNLMPAKVDAINLTDLEKVSPLTPLVITFSRNMNRESVEKAFSIDNDGQVSLSWTNDYTLNVDISNLEPLYDYTITIDGDVAFNTQTNQKFDGDGDGQEGGNYVLSFTMAEPDVEAPYVALTWPEEDGQVEYTTRVPIRIEFNETLDYNDDGATDIIVVKDSKGNTVDGVVTYDIINDASVFHFYPTTDLDRDAAYGVLVKRGFKDLSGNVMDADYMFRFLTEYRTVVDDVKVHDLNPNGSWWKPGGSGSSSGLVIDECNTTPLNSFTPLFDDGAIKVEYLFDEMDAYENWFVRLYTPNTNNYYNKDFEGVLSAWVYGMASQNEHNMMVRVPNSSGGLKTKAQTLKEDFRGWKPMTWKLKGDEYKHFTGDQELGASGNWRFDSFTIRHYWTDPDDEDVVQSPWQATAYYSHLRYTHWKDEEQQAKLDHVNFDELFAESSVSNISVNQSNGQAEYFDMQGRKLNSKALTPGLYIVKRGNTTAKQLVK